VATNKRTDLAEALIGALDLTRHFVVNAGPDRVSARKPDGAHVREAVQLAGGDPARAVMVGDATTDTGSARAAGVPCVVAGFGYNDVPLADLGGDIVIDRFSDLIAAVETLQQAATGTAAPAI
jgi:phosphoglycolate phosphatase